MNNLLINKFIQIQEQLNKKISLKNCFHPDQLSIIAGIDVAYWSNMGKDYGVCCIVVIDYLSQKIIEKIHYIDEIRMPYISGFLAFRELPLILKTTETLHSSPDIYMFDGNGYLHERHMGIATHASFYLKKPTIGIAKTYLKIKNTDFEMPKTTKGSYTDIIIENEVYGRTLRTRDNVKPIFISCGNWIDLDTATQLTMHFVDQNSRLPITTRYADLATHEVRKKQLLQLPNFENHS